MLKRPLVFLTLFTASTLMLSACTPRRSGVVLGKRYEADISTINAFAAFPRSKIRYVFSNSAVDIYYHLRNDDLASCWIVNMNGVDRLLFCVKNADGTVRIIEERENGSPAFIHPIEVDRGINHYKPADIDAVAIMKPGDWYPVLKNAPVRFEEHSMRVDWSGCKPGTV